MTTLTQTSVIAELCYSKPIDIGNYECRYISAMDAYAFGDPF